MARNLRTTRTAAVQVVILGSSTAVVVAQLVEAAKIAWARSSLLTLHPLSAQTPMLAIPLRTILGFSAANRLGYPVERNSRSGVV